MDKFDAINEAVCYWLGYQFKIGRDKLIHEASLRYPIADTLTANGVEVNRINLEKGHPFFNDRIVDIFIFDKDVNDVKKEDFLDSLVSVFELKLAKRETGITKGQENQRIIDDILRLAYFNLESKKDAYFLICGTYGDFKNYFVGQVTKLEKDEEGNIVINANTNIENGWDVKNSLYKDYFDFEMFKPPKAKNYLFSKETILPTDSEQQKEEKLFGINSFQERYKTKGSLEFGNSINVKTTCIAITPFEAITHRTHACGIWKIEGEIPTP